MGLSFLMNVAYLLTSHNRSDAPRDIEKQDRSSIQARESDRSPPDASSDDEEDQNPPSASRSRPLRHFGTIGSTLSGLGPSEDPSRTLTSSSSSEPLKPTLVSRARTLFFPTTSPGETARYVPYYRYSPIISGVIIPFSILLEIPGLTEHWYIQTQGNETVDVRPNPVILDVGLAFSMACAVFANVCLILRFSEKWIKATTLFCILFLTIHDAINIAAVTAFGVVHRIDDGYTYGQSFWMILCSTIASTITNLSLIVDYVRTKDFANSGSGLTRKQRSLVILVIILLMYIALGALINSVMLSLSYINGLYFTVVSIETIGFGDILPDSTGSRVWICFYIAFGIITLGTVITLCRDTVLEGLEIGYRKRLRQVRARRREARRFRRWQTRWRRAIEWRLRQQGSAVWVADAQWREEQGVRFVGLGGPMAGAGEESWVVRFLKFPRLRRPPPEDPARRQTKHIVGHPFGKHLNINALSDEQLHAAALEAGVPLNMFVDFSPAHKVAHGDEPPHPSGGAPADDGWPTHVGTPTDAQLGRMASILTKMALVVSGREIHAPGPSVRHREEVIDTIVEAQDEEHEAVRERRETTMAHSSRRAEEPTSPLHGKYIAAPKWLRKYAAGALAAKPYAMLKKEMQDEETSANILAIAWSGFFIFWFIGSAIFSTTEGWSYAIAMYFCFICFMTTGYGDYAPVTPAGRSIFVVWALFGVATMTILVAVIEDAFSAKYQNAMHSQVFERAVRKYRRDTADEAAEVPHAEYQLQRTAADRMRNVDAIRKGEVSVEPEAQSMAAIQAQMEEAHKKAHKELEALPHEIIRQARTFHDYMQTLRQLLDEIVANEDADERVKQEILSDDDAKHVRLHPLILSIERALKAMIHSADSALQALAERDTLMAIQTEQRANAPGGSPELEAEEAEHIGEDEQTEDDESPLSSPDSSTRDSARHAPVQEASPTSSPPSSTPPDSVCHLAR
ncbi:uncharacterized protein B0H18DRAFT_1123673 [Fomitopsis serialis]|uniref:uncharacterized protein n=1 Tax=Fomitopsis serialis TaxID=139415 RepID=UPI002007A5A1|nr:uncharacterized protein B0H18DRAFT_1123673 [Neoantrodia serialis]KAH9917328.1 hypothetical protein B0H18DRAFT_1123673 [Neoantrodia serialis]